MTSRLHRVAAAAAALAAVTGAVACSDPPVRTRDPGALALVAGVRSNMPPPEIPAELRDSLLGDSIGNQDTLYFVQVSGAPRVYHTEDTSSDCDSTDACRYETEDVEAVVDKQLSQARADQPEADVLGAIAAAARAMEGRAGRERRILVIDNGLQTAGEFRLQTPRALFSDPAELVDTLAASRRLPDLTGIEVTWVGLGSSAQPQAVPAERPRANLRDLWTAIIEKAGGRTTFAGSLADGAPAAPGLPPVTPVDVSDTPIDAGNPCPTLFDDQVGFVANQATFRDPERARTVLRPIADGLRARAQRAHLVGYVAQPERPSPRPLSLQRADAVRDLLVELGVPGTLLATEGGGLAPNADPNGPAEALAQYRRVEVLSGSCGTNPGT